MDIFAFNAKLANGTTAHLKQYRGNVVLIVNTASRCSYATQLLELEHLYRKYKDQGFVILAFPSNQFHHQEPGTDAEIQWFYETSSNVTFPIFSKIQVNGKRAPLLYQYLTMEEPFDPESDITNDLERTYMETDSNYSAAPDVKWNFTKFLINREGKVIRRYEPEITPDMMETAILSALNQRQKSRRNRSISEVRI